MGVVAANFLLVAMETKMAQICSLARKLGQCAQNGLVAKVLSTDPRNYTFLGS